MTMSYTDSTTNEVIDGKAYLLRSTDGEEVVDPARLFGGGQDGVDEWKETLEARVAAIEEALGLAPAAVDEAEDQEQGEAELPAKEQGA
jgi:hypothetical protein